MYDVTLVYPDVSRHEACSGVLYLPGYPLPAEIAIEPCALCDQPIVPEDEPRTRRLTGHGGVVVDTSAVPVNSEPMHLRCVADTAALGTIRMTIG